MKPENEALIHILDESTCLTRRQMKDYLAGALQPEEIHAAETHLNACPLCSMAMDGFAAHTDEALQAIAALNSGFLKEHFDSIAPQIHLNSMAPAATLSAPKPERTAKTKGTVTPFWRVSSVAAALLVGFGLTWYFTHDRGEDHFVSGAPIAEARPVTAAAPAVISPSHNTGNHLNTSSQPTAVPAKIKQPDTDALLAAAERKVATEKTADNNMGNSAPGSASLHKTASAPLAAPAPVEQAKPKMTARAEVPAATPPVVRARSAEQADAAPAPVVAREARKEDKDKAEKQDSYAASSVAIGGGRTAESAEDAMERGNDLYEKKHWTAALAQYKAAMNTGSKSHRHQATILAARCYINLGYKAKAAELLQGIVEEGGSKKHAAKKMLREMPAEQ